MSKTQGLGYRADIDALRAFAVVPVVLFHLGASWLPGGFLGVDVFFVISGYLITGLLIRELETGHIDLLAFWSRRILRILPALTAMVLTTFVVGHFILYAPDRYNLAVNAAGALLSVGNITHWRNYGGYWSEDAADSPLLHTWSLGVEEQFYIIYPFILLIAWRLLKNQLWIALVAGFLLGGLLYVYVESRHPTAAFYLFPTRAWELLSGAIAATANIRRPPNTTTGMVKSVLGLTLVVASYFFTTEEYQAIGASVAVLGTTLIVAAASPSTFARVGLTARPIILVGVISYSVYLWHWPLIVLGKALQAKHQIAIPSILYFGLSLIFGWFSWRFIETPIRRDKKRWVPVVLLAGVVSLALLLYSLRNFNSIEHSLILRTAQWDGERFNVNPADTWPQPVRRRMQGIDVTPRPAGRTNVYQHGIDHQYGKHKALDVLVLGDSHGLMWAPAIDAAARELGLNVKFMTADGTPVFFDPAKPEAVNDGIFFNLQQWSAFNYARLDVIRQSRPPVVIIGSAWNSTLVPSALPLLLEITRQGSSTLLLEDAPDFAIGDRNAPSYISYLGLVPDAQGRAYTKLNNLKRKADEQKAIKLMIDACPSKCRIIPTRDLFEDQDSNLLVVDAQTPLFIDDDHLSVAGAMRAESRIKSAIQAALPKQNDTDEGK